MGPQPKVDYVLAHQAQQAAEASRASRHFSALLNQADDTYRKAEQAYDDREYKKAKALFLRARHLYEKAENGSRLRDFQNGSGEETQ